MSRRNVVGIQLLTDLWLLRSRVARAHIGICNYPSHARIIIYYHIIRALSYLRLVAKTIDPWRFAKYAVKTYLPTGARG